MVKLFTRMFLAVHHSNIKRLLSNCCCKVKSFQQIAVLLVFSMNFYAGFHIFKLRKSESLLIQKEYGLE